MQDLATMRSGPIPLMLHSAIFNCACWQLFNALISCRRLWSAESCCQGLYIVNYDVNFIMTALKHRCCRYSLQYQYCLCCGRLYVVNNFEACRKGGWRPTLGSMVHWSTPQTLRTDMAPLLHSKSWQPGLEKANQSSDQWFACLWETV